MTRNRAKDSSSPIMNSSSTTPNCASGAIAAGSRMVTYASQRNPVHQLPQAERSHRNAHQHEAQHRAYPQAMEHGNDQPGRAEHDQRLLEAGKVGNAFHPPGFSPDSSQRADLLAGLRDLCGCRSRALALRGMRLDPGTLRPPV